MFHGSDYGAQQGSSSNEIVDNFSYELNGYDEQFSSHVLNHDLSENVPVHNLIGNSSTSVAHQDTSSDKQKGLTSKYLVQPAFKHTKVVHGTVPTASGRAGNSTSTTERGTTGYRCLQPFGFVKKVVNKVSFERFF